MQKPNSQSLTSRIRDAALKRPQWGRSLTNVPQYLLVEPPNFLTTKSRREVSLP